MAKKKGKGVDRSTRDPLAISVTEEQVLELVSSGLSTRKIAETLGVSRGRVLRILAKAKAPDNAPLSALEYIQIKKPIVVRLMSSRDSGTALAAFKEMRHIAELEAKQSTAHVKIPHIIFEDA